MRCGQESAVAGIFIRDRGGKANIYGDYTRGGKAARAHSFLIDEPERQDWNARDGSSAGTIREQRGRNRFGRCWPGEGEVRCDGPHDPVFQRVEGLDALAPKGLP